MEKSLLEYLLLMLMEKRLLKVVKVVTPYSNGKELNAAIQLLLNG